VYYSIKIKQFQNNKYIILPNMKNILSLATLKIKQFQNNKTGIYS